MTETTSPTQRVLVFGDDGSPGADVAWLWICNHRWPEWRADVLTAIEPPIPGRSSDHAAVLTEWESPHSRHLFAESAIGSIRTLTAVQDPRLMLDARSDADLIVVGPRRLSRTKAMVLGSTTEWLLHHPPAPLAIVRSATTVRRVLACVDGSTHAQAAVQAFTTFPWARDVEVFVVKAHEGRPTNTGIPEALASLESVGINATVDAVEGSPTDMILHQIEVREPQLVVLGTRGLTGWKRLRVGSTAGMVVRGVECSVLVACADNEVDQ